MKNYFSWIEPRLSLHFIELSLLSRGPSHWPKRTHQISIDGEPVQAPSTTTMMSLKELQGSEWFGNNNNNVPPDTVTTGGGCMPTLRTFLRRELYIVSTHLIATPQWRSSTTSPLRRIPLRTRLSICIARHENRESNGKVLVRDGAPLAKDLYGHLRAFLVTGGASSRRMKRPRLRLRNTVK